MSYRFRLLGPILLLLLLAPLSGLGCSAITDTDPGSVQPGGGGDPDDGGGADDGGGGGRMDAGGGGGRDAGGGGGRDAGGGGRDAGGGGRDAGGGGGEGDGHVACGETSCSLEDFDGCCFTERGAAFCFGEAAGIECTCDDFFCDAAPVLCDGPRDCRTGRRCCAERTIGSDFPERVVCRDSCADGATTSRLEVCQPDDGIPCAGDTTCSSSGTLPDGYHACTPEDDSGGFSG